MKTAKSRALFRIGNAHLAMLVIVRLPGLRGNLREAMREAMSTPGE
jgi:hypothetical protein